MPRASRAVVAHRRHRKVLQRAKGYRGARSRNFRTAVQAVARAEQYAYRDRRRRKRDFRRLWIVRINAACRSQGTNYSSFMAGLKEAGLQLDRKMLAQMAAEDAPAFSALMERVRADSARLS